MRATFLLTLAGALLNASAFAADKVPAAGGAIEITPMIHSSIQIEHAGKVIQIDPWSALDLARYKKADLILITDDPIHHLDLKAIQLLRKPGAPVVIPEASKVKFPDGIIMANGERATEAGVTVEAIPAYDIIPGEPSHPKGKSNGYVITLGGTRIYVAGVTECVPEVRTLKNIDVAFIPLNVPLKRMTPVAAAQCVKAIAPKIVYAYHYDQVLAARLANPRATSEGPAGGLTVAESLRAFKDALEDEAIEVRDGNWYPVPAPPVPMARAVGVAQDFSPAIPVPRVTGPIPVTATSYPFGAADHELVPENLKAIGYVEEEFLVAGTANVYDWPQAGPAIVRTPNVPYTTRVLLRRPASRAKFSGNVVVEMLNPSNLFDLNLGWAISHKQFARNGDVWVGITAKPVSVVTLKTFDPARYGALSWANPLPLDDARNCATVGADSARMTENGLVWDMNRQVGAWLKSRDRTNPLAYGVAADRPHPVQHLYAWGYSQTGGFLYTYVNAIHPLDVQATGKPLFDAYVIATASGPTPINQCSGAIPAGDPRRTIHNAGVPVVRVMSGSDYLRSMAARLTDSDVAPDLLRNYEIAGSAHATPDELNFAAAPADLVKAGRAVPPMSCNEGPRSRFPNSVAFNAIFRNLDAWVRTGVAAPRADPIRVENGAPVVDSFGNVTGGIRSPYVDVPTSTWFGNSTGASFCGIAGHEQPFDAARLKTLYPSPADYVRKVTDDVAKLVALRVMTKEDGDDLIAEARRFSLASIER